jgi:predicted outer membrane protein
MRTCLLATPVVLAIVLISCGAPSTTDFIQTAAMSDMYEVEAGKMASQKGQSDTAKQFGQHMVEAHSQTTEELKGIVQQQNIKVDLPTKLDAKDQRMIDDLTQKILTRPMPSSRSARMKKLRSYSQNMPIKVTMKR